ncbi:hypothetical protein ADEAN_001044800 [Angomonas deanei]|uniref:WD domain, G-beta repeat n=1 Tax=Angomonas deanei TaxID=59799 RepID=A0A7G2CWR1_9TRYP|nr:hypothetical protein ADEAN_001044800 [Angomonas deanei]
MVDVFSDTYGCVFPQCNGYQSPLPIVALSSAADNEVVGVVKETGYDAQDRLVFLDFSQATSCSSFKEILSRRNAPVEIGYSSQIYKKVDYVRNVVGLSHFVDSSFCVSLFFVQPDSIEELIIEQANSFSISGDTIWTLRPSKSGSDITQSNLDSADLPQYSVSCSLSTGEVFAYERGRSVVFGPSDILHLDSRTPHPDTIISLVNCFAVDGVVEEGKIVIADSREQVSLYDLRNTAEPVSSARCLGGVPSLASASNGHLLLTSKLQVGILDLSTFSIKGAAKSFDGEVLSASFISFGNDTLQFCSSTASSMVYNWSLVN